MRGDSVDFALPRVVPSVDDCRFYHSIDLGNYGVVQGDWDLRGQETQYLGEVDFKDKSVLDVGTASGFLTFSAERLGAIEIVSFDADNIRRINLLPIVRHPILKDLPAYFLEGESYLHRQKNSYWLAHSVLNSKARAYYGNVYNLPSALGIFDVVIIAQILVHLRDPIAALASAASLCQQTLIIAEGMIEDTQEPVARFISDKAVSPESIWFQLSVPLYESILSMLGFEIQRVTTRPYRCVSNSLDVPITTIVAQRVAPAVPNPFAYSI